jgi:DNA-binding transcriptional ArsR family regulator
MIELLNLAPSTVSKHMSILKQARLIEGTKNGKWVYYRLPEKTSSVAAEAIAWAKRHLTSDATIIENSKTLKAIIKRHPVEVCKKQKESRIARALETGTAAIKAHP